MSTSQRGLEINLSKCSVTVAPSIPISHNIAMQHNICKPIIEVILWMSNNFSEAREA